MVALSATFNSCSPPVGEETLSDFLSLSTFLTTPESSLLALAVVPVWLDADWLVEVWLDADGLVEDGLVEDGCCALAIGTAANAAAAKPIRNAFISTSFGGWRQKLGTRSGCAKRRTNAPAAAERSGWRARLRSSHVPPSARPPVERRPVAARSMPASILHGRRSADRAPGPTRRQDLLLPQSGSALTCVDRARRSASRDPGSVDPPRRSVTRPLGDDGPARCHLPAPRRAQPVLRRAADRFRGGGIRAKATAPSRSAPRRLSRSRRRLRVRPPCADRSDPRATPGRTGRSRPARRGPRRHRRVPSARCPDRAGP